MDIRENSTNSTNFATLFCIAFIAITWCIEVGWFPLLPDNLKDPWVVKDFLTLIGCLGLGLYGAGTTGVRLVNPWMGALIIYVCVHPFLTIPLVFETKTETLLFGATQYKPLFQLLMYGLFIGAITQVKFTDRDIQKIHAVIYWVVIIMSGYCLLQAAGLDQFQILNSIPGTVHTAGKNITGTLGHPNQCGIFLAAGLPFVLFRSKPMVIPVLLAIYFTESQMAYGGALIAITGYLWFRGQVLLRLLIGIIGSLSVIGVIFWVIQHPGIGSGRVEVWKSAWNFFINGPAGLSRVITGYGIGSFLPLSLGEFRSNFRYMQNDPFQWLFCTGAVGLGLLIFALNWLKIHTLQLIMKDAKHYAFALCLVILVGCSFGSFVFQIEPLRFLGAFCIGYLHNLKEKKL